MAEIDEELMARALRWCAEAGRVSSPAEVRDALAPLSWDALLAVRAVLADPPPTRPLGPRALVEIARGVPPDVAARRDRDSGGPARGAAPGEAAPSEAAPAARPETRRTRGKGTRRVATVVIRRARDRREELPSAEAPPPLLDELFASEGRAVVERWVRRHGARRARLVEELAAWRRPDGTPPREDDVARLLDAHGLTRAFERREREEILHAVRASGGLLSAAARALAFTDAALADAIARLGIGVHVERIREERREDIRRRATLGDRVRMLVDEGERLEDLALTEEISADLRERLREHVRALRAGTARHVAPSFARTLGITRDQASAIATRFDLDLRDAAQPAPWRDPERGARASPERRPPARGGERRPSRGQPGGGERRPSRGRPGGAARPPPARSGGRRGSAAGAPPRSARPPPQKPRR